MSTQRQMSVPIQTKTVVTVAEMARLVCLSRARFYQLVAAGTFPQPLYDVTTRRPHYVEKQQEVCLEVRRRNCGVDGKPVLFYARRVGGVAPRESAPKNSISTKAEIDKVAGESSVAEHQDPQRDGVRYPRRHLGCGVGRLP